MSSEDVVMVAKEIVAAKEIKAKPIVATVIREPIQALDAKDVKMSIGSQEFKEFKEMKSSVHFIDVGEPRNNFFGRLVIERGRRETTRIRYVWYADKDSDLARLVRSRSRRFEDVPLLTLALDVDKETRSAFIVDSLAFIRPDAALDQLKSAAEKDLFKSLPSRTLYLLLQAAIQNKLTDLDRFVVVDVQKYGNWDPMAYFQSLGFQSVQRGGQGERQHVRAVVGDVIQRTKPATEFLGIATDGGPSGLLLLTIVNSWIEVDFMWRLVYSSASALSKAVEEGIVCRVNLRLDPGSGNIYVDGLQNAITELDEVASAATRAEKDFYRGIGHSALCLVLDFLLANGLTKDSATIALLAMGFVALQPLAEQRVQKLYDNYKRWGFTYVPGSNGPTVVQDLIDDKTSFNMRALVGDVRRACLKRVNTTAIPGRPIRVRTVAHDFPDSSSVAVKKPLDWLSRVWRVPPATGNAWVLEAPLKPQASYGTVQNKESKQQDAEMKLEKKTTTGHRMQRTVDVWTDILVNGKSVEISDVSGTKVQIRRLESWIPTIELSYELPPDGATIREFDSLLRDVFSVPTGYRLVLLPTSLSVLALYSSSPVAVDGIH